MSKYRLINTIGWEGWSLGFEIDTENSINGVSIYTARSHVETFPEDWELIKENDMEKTLTITLDKAREIYGKSKEMDELLLANFSKEELEKPNLPRNWHELKILSGYFITNGSKILDTSPKIHPDYREGSQNVFATEKQAKSALAMAQLSQLMKVYNDGWEPDWTDDNKKYCISRNRYNVRLGFWIDTYHFLAFPTEELGAKFLKNFEPLIKQYFMLD